MSLYLFRDSHRPSQLLDQHFGLGMSPEDLLAPFTIPNYTERLLRCPSYCRPWQIARKDSGSVVKCNKDEFQVNLDVQQFSPEEITVKVVDDCVVVEGKHEEKQDEHGFISRQFVRKYVLPKGHDVKAISSALSSDGILTITAPKIAVENKKEVVIPITHTGPVKNIKEKETKEEKKKAEK